jgi:hypothetical protein
MNASSSSVNWSRYIQTLHFFLNALWHSVTTTAPTCHRPIGTAIRVNCRLHRFAGPTQLWRACQPAQPAKALFSIKRICYTNGYGTTSLSPPGPLSLSDLSAWVLLLLAAGTCRRAKVGHATSGGAALTALRCLRVNTARLQVPTGTYRYLYGSRRVWWRRHRGSFSPALEYRSIATSHESSPFVPC